MKKNVFIYLLISVMFTSVFTSCDKDDPEVPNEEELITTLVFTLTPSAGGTTVEFKFQDLDGDGGNDPVITNGTLAANTTYTGAITLTNEQEDPAEDITEEVKEEALEHQFFFQTTVSGLSVSYNDKDSEGNPIGLSTNVTTTDTGTGTLTITLRHQPDKSATNVSSGDITNAGGETDISVTFDVLVE